MGNGVRATALAFSLLWVVGQALSTVRTAPRPAAAGSMSVVDSTADSADGDVTDGICLYLNGKCTRRAAILHAN